MSVGQELPAERLPIPVLLQYDDEHVSAGPHRVRHSGSGVCAGSCPHRKRRTDRRHRLAPVLRGRRRHAPPDEDETASYPTAIITQIFQDLQALSPSPTFGVSTGDYQYANPTGTQGAAQIDLYLGARANYSGTMFPTMGDHECTGATASNCGTGNSDGLTNNYNSYVSKLLAPINQTSPYYEIDVGATDGSWTSKFLFVAANAWTQTQADWLQQAMGRSTTYTFLIRHEAASASTAPGVNPAENIMAKLPYTLSIVGHTHAYQHSGPREVIIGNGGAPLSGTGDYGFGMISQQADGTIAVDMIDYTSGLSDSSFHFAVNPDGSAAP